MTDGSPLPCSICGEWTHFKEDCPRGKCSCGCCNLCYDQKKQAEAAQKFDTDKLQWSLLPMDALSLVVKVMMFGAKKYSVNNWRKGMEWTRLYDAAKRHMDAWLGGEDLDPESGLPHIAHAICCLLFALWYGLKGVGSDDRYKNIVVTYSPPTTTHLRTEPVHKAQIKMT